MKKVPLLLILTFLAYPAWAEELFTLPEIVGVSDRFLKEDHSKTVIDSAEITRSNARTVGDLLKRSAGVDFGQNISGSAYAYLRGSSSSQTLVLIDGVRMNDPSSASRAFDFSSLDLAQIESITILKGPQSVSFGNDAAGGVILIRTKSSGPQRFATARHETGARSSYRGNLSASTPLGELSSLQFNLSRDFTQGISTAAVPFGDADGSESASGTVAAEIRPTPSFEIDLRSGMDFSRQDLDDAAAQDDPNYVARVRTLRNSVLTRTRLTSESELHAGASHLDLRRAYDDLGDTVSAGTFDGIYRGQQSSFDLSLKNTIENRREFALGVSLQREKFDLDSTTGRSSQQSRSVGAFAQTKVHLNSAIALDGGVRHDRTDELASRMSYRAGSELRLTEKTKLHLRAGTAFKAPSLPARFDPTSGNPSLRPEKSRSIEAGGTWTPSEKLELAVTAFKTRYKDLITYLSSFPYTSQNTDQAEIRGIEFSSLASIGRYRFRPHATYLRAFDRENGAELPRRARWKVGLVLNIELNDRFSFEVEGIAKTSRLDLAGSSTRAPGYALWNASLGIRINESIRAFVRAENLLDHQYQEIVGFHSFGRGAFAGLEARF